MPTPEAIEEMDISIKRAYAEALKASHAGQQVTIHIGIEVAEYLRSLSAWRPLTAGMYTTFWGFSCKIEDDLVVSPRHVSIRTMTLITA